MNLFIASLATEEGADHADLARLGILAASLVSGVAGFFSVRAGSRGAGQAA